MNQDQLRKLHTLMHTTANHYINVHMRDLHMGTVSASAVDKTRQAMYDAERAALETIDKPVPICPPVPSAIDYRAMYNDSQLRVAMLRDELQERDALIRGHEIKIAELSCDDALNEANGVIAKQRSRMDILEQRNARQAEVIGTRDNELNGLVAQVAHQRDTIETLDKTIAGLRHAVNVLEGRISNAMQQLHNGPKS